MIRKKEETVNQKINIAQNANQKLQNIPLKKNEKMQKAYNVSSKIFKSKAERVLTEEELRLLSKEVEEADIIVTTGSYDHAETVFRALHVPHIVVNPSDVMNINLSPDKILFVNCPGTGFGEEGLKKIKRFVASGGMLVTTDWALKNVLEPLFPEYVKYNGVKTADDVVKVKFNREEDSFFAKFIDEQDEPLWWLEVSSYPITVLDPNRVKVLAYSDEMKRKYGESPIIISFEYKLGIVYHMTSHLYLQRSDTRTARHKKVAIAYAAEKGIALDNLTEEEKKQLEELKLSEVESAYTSQVAINRMIYEQRKRVEERKKQQLKK